MKSDLCLFAHVWRYVKEKIYSSRLQWMNHHTHVNHSVIGRTLLSKVIFSDSLNTYMHIFIHTNTYTHTYIHTDTHTHTHRHNIYIYIFFYILNERILLKSRQVRLRKGVWTQNLSTGTILPHTPALWVWGEGRGLWRRASVVHMPPDNSVAPAPLTHFLCVGTQDGCSTSPWRQSQSIGHEPPCGRRMDGLRMQQPPSSRWTGHTWGQVE